MAEVLGRVAAEVGVLGLALASEEELQDAASSATTPTAARAIRPRRHLAWSARSLIEGTAQR